jgi:hypothetical protein
MFLRGSLRTLVVLVPLALSSASCTSSVDLKQTLEVTETASGWYDAGIVDGKNKVVPTVSFRLRKKADVDLDGVSVNVVFRHPPAAGSTDEEDWDEVFVQNARFSEGTQTPLLTVRTEKGYTGEPPQSRLEMLKNSYFRDVRARIFAKHSASQWVDIGSIDVQRQLIVR